MRRPTSKSLCVCVSLCPLVSLSLSVHSVSFSHTFSLSIFHSACLSVYLCLRVRLSCFLCLSDCLSLLFSCWHLFLDRQFCPTRSRSRSFCLCISFFRFLCRFLCRFLYFSLSAIGCIYVRMSLSSCECLSIAATLFLSLSTHSPAWIGYLSQEKNRLLK